MRALVLGAVSGVGLVAASAAADPLQDQVVAAMRRVDTGGIAFTATTQVGRTGEPGHRIVTRYDPRAATGQRWAVVSYDGRAPTAKERDGVLKAANRSPVPAYARMARWFGAPATRVAQTAGSVTYRFARLPGGVLKIGSHDASADTVADAVVDTSGAVPFVRQVRLSSTTGFRMMLVAKVERYVFSSSYALLPDGRPFVTGNDADISGAMMGKSGTLTTRVRYEAR